MRREKKMIKKNSLITSLFLFSSIHGFCQQKVPASERPEGRVNYPSNFQVEKGADVILFGEYLYWIAHEDGLYYAQTGGGSGTTSVPPNGNTDFNGHLKKVEPEWDSGLRAGLGYNFPLEGYDVLIYWTWFSTSAHDSTHADEKNILPLWAQPDFSPQAYAQSAKGKWNLDLNVGDLEWGRSSWFGGHFSFRPFFGIRGLCLDQDLKNNYIYNTNPAIRGDLHLDSDFRGGGLRAGADARFALPCGFSIYGLASGSLLYGRFYANMNFKENSLAIAKTKSHFSKGVSSLQLALGLGWDTHFLKDHCHIEFHVGWEQNAWFSVNQMNHFMNQFHNGSFFKENSNLILQGLVAGGRFDF
jgi:hypothetical protein